MGECEMSRNGFNDCEREYNRREEAVEMAREKRTDHQEPAEADDLVRECRAIICELCNTFTIPKPNATLDRIDAYLARRQG